MYNHILVPLDGSKTAEKVLPVVIAEAKCHDASVVLLRVIAPFRSSLMAAPTLLEQANEHVMRIAQEYLAVLAADLSSKGIVVETKIDRGPPAQRILEFADSYDCDLIIIGSRGETGALRWRFGGTAAKVVRAKTSMPVLVVTT